MAVWQDVPPKLQAMILRELASQADWANASTVSRRINRLVAPFLYESPCLSSGSEEGGFQELLRLRRLARTIVERDSIRKHIRSLCVSGLWNRLDSIDFPALQERVNIDDFDFQDNFTSDEIDDVRSLALAASAAGRGFASGLVLHGGCGGVLVLMLFYLRDLRILRLEEFGSIATVAYMLGNIYLRFRVTLPPTIVVGNDSFAYQYTLQSDRPIKPFALRALVANVTPPTDLALIRPPPPYLTRTIVRYCESRDICTISRGGFPLEPSLFVAVPTPVVTWSSSGTVTCWRIPALELLGQPPLHDLPESMFPLLMQKVSLMRSLETLELDLIGAGAGDCWTFKALRFFTGLPGSLAGCAPCLPSLREIIVYRIGSVHATWYGGSVLGTVVGPLDEEDTEAIGTFYGVKLSVVPGYTASRASEGIVSHEDTHENTPGLLINPAPQLALGVNSKAFGSVETQSA